MHEFRQDSLLGHAVMLAPERTQRRQEFLPPAAGTDITCDFCEGSEATTPEEVFAVRAKGTRPQTPGWRVRVVPNKFPAVAPICCREEERSRDTLDGPEETQADVAYGAHEVIIESPRHLTRLRDVSLEQWLDILRTYRARFRFWSNDGRLRYLLLFKNHGALAGASLQHLHSQLLALPFVPPAAAAEHERFEAYLRKHGRGPLTVLLASEQAAGHRIVTVTEHFVCFCPFASRFAGETWIVPRQPGISWNTLPGSMLLELGGLIRQVTVAIEDEFQQAALNFMLQTAPFDTNSTAHYHWRLEITPRTSMVAGCELASGVFINTLPPEVAAERLRSQVSVGPAMTT